MNDQETVDDVLEEIRSLVNAPKFTREGILFYAERILAATPAGDYYKRGREEAWNELRRAAIAHGGVTNMETGETIALDSVDLPHVGAELHAKANAFESGYRRGMHDERGRAPGCLRVLLADYSARDPELIERKVLTQKLAHLIATIEAAP